MPSRDIHSLKVLCHLGNHDRIETTIGEACLFFLYHQLAQSFPKPFFLIPYSKLVLDNVPKLLGHDIAWVVDLDVSSL